MISYLLFFFIFLLGIIWGSFLNVVGYRIVKDDSILVPSRSFCPVCLQSIAWFDLVPIISFFALKGRCRKCTSTISVLYPLIEFLTGLIGIFLFYGIDNIYYQIAYFIFLSALIVIIRSDLETMLISQLTTLWFVPIGFGAAYFHFLPISFFDSIFGALSAYCFLWCISSMYIRYKNVTGIGEGDIDMLAMIGAFTGTCGWWISLMVASFGGCFVAFCLMMTGNLSMQMRIPFGPFLALGAMIAVFFKEYIMQIILPC